MSKNPTIFNIRRWVGGTKRLMFQVLFFFIISCKVFAKIRSIYFLIFSNFTKIKIKSFECPSQQPTVLFSIYQNNTWTITRLVDETIDPVTQCIICLQFIVVYSCFSFIDFLSTKNNRHEFLQLNKLNSPGSQILFKQLLLQGWYVVPKKQHLKKTT